MMYHVKARSIKALEKQVNVLLIRLGNAEVVTVFPDRDQGNDIYVAIVQARVALVQVREGL